MAYFLKPWTGNDGSERLYIQGTSRDSIYLKLGRQSQKLVWSSKANDTPHKFQTGNHYGKIRKDEQAALDACAAFGLALGGGEDQWARAKEIAASGVSYNSVNEEDKV